MAAPRRQFANILIVKLSAIGDVVHALPVAHALKRCFPGCRITWVVEKPSRELLLDNPCVDEVILFEKPRFKSLQGLWRHAPGFAKMLRAYKFDLALDLQALFKSGAIAYLSGAPTRLVYCDTRELSGLLSTRVCGPNRNAHIVERLLDVVRALGCAADRPEFPLTITADEARRAEAAARQAGLDMDRPYVVLSPGANWPNKRWPAGHFAALADRVAARGVVPVLTGGPGDGPLAGEIAARSGAVVDLTGGTTLKELAHIIRRAEVFVGGDTGPMHLAAALGTAVVALYGPTDIVRNGPYGEGHVPLVVSRECAGCWERKCGKGHDCLAAIDADEVFEAVARRL